MVIGALLKRNVCLKLYMRKKMKEYEPNIWLLIVVISWLLLIVSIIIYK